MDLAMKIAITLMWSGILPFAMGGIIASSKEDDNTWRWYDYVGVTGFVMMAVGGVMIFVLEPIIIWGSP